MTVTSAPATATERTIASVWSDVLGLTEVGVTDSFFDVGGGSLAIVAVQRQLNRLLGTELRVVDLFRHPTVRSLAARIDAGDGPVGGAAGPVGTVAASVDAAVARAAGRGAARRERAQRRSADRDSGLGSVG